MRRRPAASPRDLVALTVAGQPPRASTQRRMAEWLVVRLADAVLDDAALFFDAVLFFDGVLFADAFRGTAVPAAGLAASRRRGREARAPTGEDAGAPRRLLTVFFAVAFF